MTRISRSLAAAALPPVDLLSVAGQQSTVAIGTATGRAIAGHLRFPSHGLRHGQGLARAARGAAAQ